MTKILVTLCAGLLVVLTSIMLLRHDDSISIRQIRNESFVRAAWDGNVHKMQFLMLLGAGLNCRAEDGDSALTRAAAAGQCETIEFLLAQGAHINQRDEFGTPLINAVLQGREKAVKLLLASGADVHIVSEVVGGTALELAKAGGKSEIVKLLEKAEQKKVQAIPQSTIQ